MYQTKLAKPNTPVSFPANSFLLEYHENGLNTSLGAYGEQYLCKQLCNEHYLAEIVANLGHVGDLRILDTWTGEMLQIEVKTAYETANGHYKFCLNKKNHTSLSYSEFVILLCIDKYLRHYTYIIPTSLLYAQSLTISSHPTKYSGKYSAFIQRGQICFDAARLVAELW